MYWPFFRSKQEELLALRELGASINTDLIVPIIKPHSASDRVEGQLSRALDAGIRVALIVNTDEGAPVPNVSDIREMEARLSERHPGQIFPSLEVRPAVSVSDVQSFSRDYAGRLLVFVHRSDHLHTSEFPRADVVHVFVEGNVSTSFVQVFSASRTVLLEDGFNKQVVNGDYPNNSYFYDLHSRYSDDGFDGFGDFATIGDERYSTGGGRPSHIALHLTEPQADGSLRCLHFVSDVPPESTNNETKYLSAVSKLVSYTQCPDNGAFGTIGVSDYCASQASFPGLGKPKRWSTKHHIETVNKNLVSANAPRWM